jgi:hypothetical protein
MATDVYLDLNAGVFSWKTSINSFTGSADAGKLVALDTNGRLDLTLMPVGLTAVGVGLGGGSIATNIAIGLNTLIANTTGVRNTVVGYEAEKTSAAANDVTAIGYNALKIANSSAINNTAIGSGAFAAVTSAQGGVALGYAAGSIVSTGNTNVIIGSAAGQNITTGAGNICIGASTFLSAAADVNSIVIGSNATGVGSNSAVIGDANVTLTQLRGAVRTGAVAVASLLAAATAGQSARCFVTDSNQTLTAGIGAVVAGGGANKVPVVSDGTNWRIG